MEKQLVSKKRVAAYGEVFTRKREVSAMLDLVKQETERIESRFLEPDQARAINRRINENCFLVGRFFDMAAHYFSGWNCNEG